MNEDRVSQLSELEALKSVLRDGKLQYNGEDSTEISGYLEVDFDSLPEHSCTIEATISDSNVSHQLEMIPPCQLKFQLPAQYPSVSSPNLTIESDWMTGEQKHSLEDDMKRICEENLTLPVLFFCYQTIIDKIEESPPKVIKLNEAYVFKERPSLDVAVLLKRLIGESERAVEENFVNTLYECKVCFQSYLGDKCVRFLPCNHVFCKTCTYQYYKCTTNDQAAKVLCCLEDKCTSEAPQWLIREALDDEQFSKYDECMLQKAIQDMDDVVRCPREKCGKVAYLTDLKTNLVECSYCSFSFCNLCKQSYHGVGSCKFGKEERDRILKNWKDGDEREREIMCKEYGGEKNMKALIERFENENWFSLNSKPCPKCKVNIEKTDGCHKMHCTKCDALFCWLCAKVLRKDDPYMHFRDDGECSGRLFEGVIHDIVPFDDDDDDAEFGDDEFLAAMFGREDDFEAEYEDENAVEAILDYAFDDGSDEDEDFIDEEEEDDELKPVNQDTDGE